MQKQITLKLLPSEAADIGAIKTSIAKNISQPVESISGYHLLKRSIDARSRQAWINLTVHAFINEPLLLRQHSIEHFEDVSNAANKVIIIGAGPAGLFAALRFIQLGIKPIVLERGKDVRARRRDLATLNKEGVVNPESNYCFGEGGAGTYSDGKLYTRSNKRGDINRILNLFVQFGADENILVEAHPHIGTNKLPTIITAMRQQILDSGGGFLFDKKVVDFQLTNNRITGVTTADGDTIVADSVVLATGHSARDIFTLLHKKEILIQSKPFALGVRVEHPQAIIDTIQYHCTSRGEYLPPASYSLVQQVEGRGVFSFCMCPGGIIAPAATNPNEIVVNGWSPSKRNNPYANSGMVVSIEQKDLDGSRQFQKYLKEKGVDENSPLAMMYFQEMVERACYTAGGEKFIAPAQRLVDFCSNKISDSLPDCSYLPGIHSSDLKEPLPPFVHKSLQEGFKAFGKKMRGYYTNDAIVVATESRTSSPVRVPRDNNTLQHPQIKNLYPCGEGAGYAGGIVSAAMDGVRVANAITQAISNKA